MSVKNDKRHYPRYFGGTCDLIFYDLMTRIPLGLNKRVFGDGFCKRSWICGKHHIYKQTVVGGF